MVIGDREQQAGAVALRLRSGEDLGAQPLESVVARMKAAAASRSQTL
jgi:threonyl-tRNA synthetase